jgi:hypothetical protein
VAIVLFARAVIDDPVAIDDELQTMLASFAHDRPKLGGRSAKEDCSSGRAHLVLGVRLGQLDRLLEDAIMLL